MGNINDSQKGRFFVDNIFKNVACHSKSKYLMKEITINKKYKN